MADSENIQNFRKRGEADHAAKIRHHSEGHADFAADAKMIKEAMKEHDDQQHGGKRTKIKFRADGGAAEGESAARRHDRPRRADGGGTAKKSSGKGDGKHGARVNVIIAPQHPPMMGGGLPAPGGAPMGPARPPGPPVPPPPPPMPMGGAPGGMPPRPMPGMPGGGAPMPMMPPRKDGGRVKRAAGGSTGTTQSVEKSDNQGGKGRENGNGNASASDSSRMKEQMGPYAKGGMAKRSAGGGLSEDFEDKKPRGEGVGEEGAGGGEGRLNKIKAYGKFSTKGEED